MPFPSATPSTVGDCNHLILKGHSIPAIGLTQQCDPLVTEICFGDDEMNALAIG
jgi:hypothetical protein